MSPPRSRSRPRTHLNLVCPALGLLVALVLAPGATAAPAPAAPITAGDAAAPSRLWTPGVLDPAKGFPGRWARELDRRARVLSAGRARDPGRIVGLLGLLVELQGELPNRDLAALLERTAASRSQDPLVRSFAGYQRARLYEAEGERDRAIERYRAEGYALDWQLLGPFDNSSLAGHNKAYGPEVEPFDPNQRFEGKLPGEALEWRTFGPQQALQSAFVPLDQLIDPSTQATAYMTTWVRTSKPGQAVLHLGTSGAYKVWVNGQLAGEGDVYRVPHPLQEAHEVTLAAGWNRVLLKLSVDDGLWGLFARFSQPDGAPLAEFAVSATPDDDHGQRQAPGADVVPPDPGAKEPKPPRSPRNLLEARARDKRARPADKLALVEFNHWTHAYDAGDRTPVARAREADAVVKSSRSAFFLSRADPDQNTSREALRVGITRARAEGPASRPLLAQMLVDLAYRYQALSLRRRARDLFDEAAQAAPDDAEIELILVNRLADDGFALAAVEWVEDMRRRYPDSGMILREHASRVMELGRTQEGLALYDQLQRGRLTDTYIADNIIEGLLRLGKGDEAVAVARRRVDAAPGLPEAYRELARLEEARGDLDAAREAFARASELAPLDDELHADFGRLLARAGDRQQAVFRLRRSLELKPQQPDLRDLLATLDTSAKSDLLARYDVELEQLAKKPIPASWKGKDAGVLFQRVVVSVLPNGLTERLDHRVIRILDDRGIRSQMVHAMPYDPAESYVDIRRARVRRADGTVEELGEPSAVSLTEAGYRMYYDQRLQRVIFRGLRVGDTIEVAFVRRDVAARNKFDDYFGELTPREGLEPIRYSEFVLEAPAGRTLHFNLKGVERSLSKDKRTAIYKHVVKDRSGIKPESNMPGWTEYAQYLHVSTFASWDEVGTWYWDLVKEQLVIDDKIKAGVRAALADLPRDASTHDKVGAIYRHVIRSTRYVGLEFGIHGYKPYRTTDVYDRKFGDCKDKASLLKVMLGEVGVGSFLVLVRTRDQGSIGPAPASLAAFNHAIVYVPELDLYLDGTAEFSGPDELPAGDQGASVLVVKDGAGAELRTIPISRARHNRQDTNQRVMLAADGAARVKHELVMTGTNASPWRANLQTAETRKEKLTNAWGRYFAGIEVDSVATPGIDDVLKPVVVNATFTVPRFGQPDGDALRFLVFGYGTSLVRSLAPQAKREHDLELSTPGTEHHTITYELPRGYVFSRVPQSARHETAAAAFQLEVKTTASGATVESTLEYKKHRIKASEYREFREFLRQVDASLEQTFELRPGR